MTGNLPGWMSPKKARQNINRRSAKQERKRAEEINGRTQAGSGSSRRAPQDVRGTDNGEEVMEQIKFTDGDGIRISADDLDQLLADALRAGREAQLVVDFANRGIRLVARVERARDHR